jgi:hypothetical protein
MAGFNRMEYFLQLHSAPINVTCWSVPPHDGATITFRSSVFQAWESLTMGRVYEPGLVWDNRSCEVTGASEFVFHNHTPNVVVSGGRRGRGGRRSSRISLCHCFTSLDSGALISAPA